MTQDLPSPVRFPRRSVLNGLATATLMLAAGSGYTKASNGKEVLAFYYGWYGDTAHTFDAIPDKPVAGPYDSLDPATILRHASEASAAGLTGLIASWWGQGDRTDQQLPALLKACGDKDIAVCAYFEQAATPEALCSDILYIYHRYAQSPNWLKLAGKPVICLFDRVLQTIGLDGWQKARTLVEAAAPKAMAFIGTANSLDEIAARKTSFDALHIYSVQFDLSHPDLEDRVWRRTWYQDWVKAQSGLKVKTATVLPGYDDHLLDDRTGKRPTIDRALGETFKQVWHAAARAKPDWLLIVSFNEWSETTQIEPSMAHGDRELKACRQMSDTFRA